MLKIVDVGWLKLLRNLRDLFCLQIVSNQLNVQLHDVFAIFLQMKLQQIEAFLGYKTVVQAAAELIQIHFHLIFLPELS